MNYQKIIDHMIADYKTGLTLYDQMQRYYLGDHDITLKGKDAVNKVVVDNFVNKFITEEVMYSLGNPLAYVSMTEDSKIADAVYSETFHWKDNHNQNLMRTLEIFGKAYMLHYVDYKGRFCERILSPMQAIVYTDDNDVPMIFIYFYKKKFDNDEYRDIYYPDGTIETYRNNSLIASRSHIFKGCPVSVCEMENIEDTIFFKIHTQQDRYNQILTDQCSIIESYKNAYLLITGAPFSKEQAEMIKEKQIINIPNNVSNGSPVKWIFKDVPDTFIQNMIKNLKDSMYSVTNHIDGNEKLQSNTSGSALRNRLVFLEQRCNLMLDIVIDAVYDRIARLFEYLDVKGMHFDVKDIKVVASPSIPKDEIGTVQMLSQLGIGTNISLETALSLLPFVENPANKISKIKQERKNNQSIELDKIDDDSDFE